VSIGGFRHPCPLAGIQGYIGEWLNEAPHGENCFLNGQSCGAFVCLLVGAESIPAHAGRHPGYIDEWFNGPCSRPRTGVASLPNYPYLCGAFVCGRARALPEHAFVKADIDNKTGESDKQNP
jgi:hypothetical protein